MNHETNRKAIQENYRDDFDRCDTLELGCRQVIEDVLNAELPFGDETRLVLVGTLVRDLRRFRSAVMLCEFGMLENADILTRSLFESMLCVRFILNQVIDDAEQSSELKNNLDRLPATPPEVNICDFRTKLYLAKDAMDAFKHAMELGEVDGDVESQMLGRINGVDAKWQKALKYCSTGSGLKIRHLAEYCGRESWYRQLYGQLSATAHAADASRYIKFDKVDGVPSLLLNWEPEEIARFLNFAMAMMLAEALSIRDGLEITLPESLENFSFQH